VESSLPRFSPKKIDQLSLSKNSKGSFFVFHVNFQEWFVKKVGGFKFFNAGENTQLLLIF
jgi:hypothetical protein